jgi:hypothetical protein
VIAGLVVGGVAVATAIDSEPTPLMTQIEGAPLSYADTITHRRAALSVQDASSRVLKGLDPKVVLEAHLVAGRPTSLDPDVPWLEVRLAGESVSDASEVLLSWYGSLAQGAITELMHSDEVSAAEIIGGSEFVVELPAGDPVTLDGGVGFVATGQVFAAEKSSSSDEDIAIAVRETLAKHGLLVDQVKVYRPLGPAVYVRATLPDGVKGVGSFDDLLEAISGVPKAYEGIYLESDDVRGIPRVAGGTAYRTGLSGLWFAPGQDEVFDVAHGGRITMTPEVTPTAMH